MTIEDYRALIDMIVQAAVTKAEANHSDVPAGHYEADRNAAADALARLMINASRR